MPRSRSTSSSAEEVAGSIDTLSEILLRLPAKSLLRFKCVSKQWLALISDPGFCYSHTLRHQNPCALLLPDKGDPSPPPNLHIIPFTTASTLRALNLGFLNHPEVAVVCSCNGLLLCRSLCCPSYLVCNPTTRKFVTLSFPDQQFRNQVHALYLAFDPVRSPHFQVLSIRKLGSQKFKVPCVFNEYSSRTRSWSDPGVSFTAPEEGIECSGVYCNRAIHWYNGGGGSSVYFDIDSQCLKYSPMPLPNEVIWNRAVEYFGESGGRLHLIFSERTLHFDILELKEDNSVWSLRHRVDLNPMRDEFPELRWDLANFVLPFYIVGPAIEESSMLALLVGGTAISYDLVHHTSRKLCDFKPDMAVVEAVACYMSGEVFQCFENLSFVETFTAYC